MAKKIFRTASNRSCLALLMAVLLSLRCMAFEEATHKALSVFAARDHHQSEVKQALTDFVGLSGDLYTRVPDVTDIIPGGSTSLLQLLGRGAEDEDAGFGRVPTAYHPGVGIRIRMARHFYDPITRKGLDDSAITVKYLSDADWRSLYGPEIASFQVSLREALKARSPFTNSLRWAWDNKGWQNDLGPQVPEDFSWSRARQSYIDAMLEKTPEGRAENMGMCFFSLGHIIHLVQDLSQPQHTRNDAHMPSSLYDALPLGGDDAPFEKFCLDRYGTLEQVQALPPERVPQFYVAWNPSQDADGIPRDLSAFWDTGQLRARGAQPVNGFPNTLGLAEFSNAFFVTSDTMFSGEPNQLLAFRDSANVYQVRPRGPLLEAYDRPHIYASPSLKSISGLPQALGNYQGAITLTRLGERFPHLDGSPLALDIPRIGSSPPLRIQNYCAAKFNSSKGELELGLTDANREAHARVLLPKAVAYSTGLLNYFFRGRLNLEFVGGDDRQLHVKVTNRSENKSRAAPLTVGETLTGGSFWLLGENAEDGERETIGQIFPGNGFSGALASGESFEANLAGTRGVRMRNFIVYKGTMGTEKDIAVGVGYMELKDLRLAGVPAFAHKGEVLTVVPELRDSKGNSVYLSRENIVWEIWEDGASTPGYDQGNNQRHGPQRHPGPKRIFYLPLSR